MSIGWLLTALVAAAPLQQVVLPTQPEQLGSQLRINGDQATVVEDALNTANNEAGPLVQEMLTIRQELLTLALTEGTDSTEALARYAEVAARMTALEARAFSDIYRALRENQQSRAPQAFRIMGGIFLPAANSAVGGRGGN